MELNHELKIMKALFYILVLLFFYSCGEADCNQIKKAYFPDEYYIFVTQSKVDLTWIKLEGLFRKPVREQALWFTTTGVLERMK